MLYYHQKSKKGKEKMKVLYVVNTYDEKYVNFRAVKLQKRMKKNLKY